jgi:archaellin
MTGTKIVVVVLVLIAVVFVVFIVVGIGNDDPKKQPTSANINQQPMPSIVGRLGQVIGSHGPKLDAAHMHPALTVFDLQKQRSYTIAVLPDNDNAVRQAEFKVTLGNACAHLVFDAGKGAPDGFNKPQDTHANDPNSKVPNRNDVTFSIPKQGGSLTIDREVASSTATCTVTLK